MTNHLFRVVLVSLFAGVGSLSELRPAVAAETSSEVAKREFAKGSKHFQLGEFDEAIASYKAGYKAKADPGFLYNIAQAYRLKNDFTNALFFYRSYLSAQPEASNRAAVEERIHKLEVELERQRQLASSPPNGAVAPTLALPAAEPSASGPPQAVSPAKAPADATAAQVAAPARGLADTSRRTPAYKKWWVWTLAGVAAAAAVGVGVGVGVASSKPQAPSTQLGTVAF